MASIAAAAAAKCQVAHAVESISYFPPIRSINGYATLSFVAAGCHYETAIRTMFSLVRYSRESESVLEMSDVFGWKSVWVNRQSLSFLKGEASVFVLRHAAPLSFRTAAARPSLSTFPFKFHILLQPALLLPPQDRGDNSFPPPSAVCQFVFVVARKAKPQITSTPSSVYPPALSLLARPDPTKS